MEILKRVGTTGFMVVKIVNKVLRCDLYLRQIDLLDADNYLHQRALNTFNYEAVTAYDKQYMFEQLFMLLNKLTVDQRAIRNAYYNDRNQRFSLVETEDQLVQIDHELWGLKDFNDNLFAVSYRKKQPEPMKGQIIREYCKVNKEVRRIVELASQVAQYSVKS